PPGPEAPGGPLPGGCVPTRVPACAAAAAAAPPSTSVAEEAPAGEDCVAPAAPDSSREALCESVRCMPEVSVPPGKRKPAMDLRSAAARSASLMIDCEVALVESADCVLISRSTCMLRASACAADACPRALAEMFCTRLAIWLDT